MYLCSSNYASWRAVVRVHDNWTHKSKVPILCLVSLLAGSTFTDTMSNAPMVQSPDHRPVTCLHPFTQLEVWSHSSGTPIAFPRLLFYRENFIYLFLVFNESVKKNLLEGWTVTAFFGQNHASKARPRLMLFCVYIHSFTGISLKSSAIYLCHLL